MALTRKYLEELGIEKEIADKIFEEHGKSIKAEQAKFADYDELKANYENLGKEVEKLKKVDPEKLQEQLTTLTENHKTELENIDIAHKQAIKEMAVKMMLTNTQDADLVLSQLDLDKIELDESHNVKGGFDEQIKTLQESKPFLFKSEEKKYEGFKPQEGEQEKESKIYSKAEMKNMTADEINANWDNIQKSLKAMEV